MSTPMDSEIQHNSELTFHNIQHSMLFVLWNGILAKSTILRVTWKKKKSML